MTYASCIHYSMHTYIWTWQKPCCIYNQTFTQTLTLQWPCLQYCLHISRNNEFKSYFKGLTCLQHYKTFLHAGFTITFRHSMTKPFWTSTCNTGHDEVSASARSFSAHKSKHNLSTYPLHLQEFGWYFRPLLSVYTGILRIEAQRNWRLKSSCQKSPDECSCYSWGDRNQLYWHCPALLVPCWSSVLICIKSNGAARIFLHLSPITVHNLCEKCLKKGQ